jgi:excisionase family DNA binding protein
MILVNSDTAAIPLLLTVAETQKLLRLGRGKTYALIRSKEIPSVRLGGAIRIPRDALLHVICQQQQEFPDTGAKLYSVPPPKEGK